MKKHTTTGFLILSAALVLYGNASAISFKAYPGLYTSYEYTDNYFGIAKGEQSESTYEVGPLLEIRGVAPAFECDLFARLSRSLHNRFDRDDATEADVTTHATLSQVHQRYGLAYEYLQTSRRATLAEPVGLLKSHIGSATFTSEMTPRATLSLGYDITKDYREAPDEDQTSQAGNVLLSYQLTQRNTMDMTYRYDFYAYERSPDADVSTAGLAWWYTATPRLRVGLSSGYMHEKRDELTTENRYDLSANGTYSITEHTNFSISGGQSWLVMEHQDRENTYTMSASLGYAFDRDRVSISVSKGYTAEFTSTLYGVYDTRSASLTLEKALLAKLTGTAALTYAKTIPTRGTLGEEETDTVARASLAWDPIRYATVSAVYERLQHDYEISDTEKENRYRMIVEVWIDRAETRHQLPGYH
jgi:hypothetical protein